MRVRLRRRLTAYLVACATVVGLLVLVAPPASAHAARPVVTGLSVHSGSARGGTRLTVYGRNFTHVRAVVFSGVPARKVHRISSHRVRVTAPFWRLHPHPYVYVTTAAGSSKATGAARFTYHPVPPPSVRAMSTHFASNSGSTSFRIYGQNFVDVYGVEIGSRNAYRVYRRSDQVLDVVLNPQASGLRYTRVTTRWGTSEGNAASRVQFVDPPMITHLSTDVGPTGGDTDVTLYGKNFDHLAGVHFGAAAATHVIAVSPTEIRARTPAHVEGLIHAIVTTDHGSSQRSDYDRFRYARTQAARWSQPTKVDPVGGNPQALSCPTTTFCALIDETGMLTYDGSTWQDTRSPVDLRWAGVECHSSQMCIAWSDLRDESIWDGKRWSAAAPMGPEEVRAVDCTGDTFCRLTDSHGAEFVFDGTSFTPTGDHLQSLIALQCISETDCTALDENGTVYQRTPDGWTAGASLGEHDNFYFGSCPDDGSCLAVAYHGRTFAYDGATWHETDAAPSYVQALSCASAGYCVAIDQFGSAHERTSGEWASGVPVLDTRYGLFRWPMACPAEQSCLIVDQQGELHPFEHNTAGPGTTIDGRRGDLSDISCATATSCVAVDRGRYATETHDGTTWSTPHLGIGSAVSCPTTMFCMAVGDRWASVYDGTSWSGRIALLDEDNSFRDVTCPTSTFCLATVDDGRVTTWNGRTWSSPVKPLAAHIDLASCPAAGDCTAVTDTNDLITLHSGTWRRATALSVNDATFEDITAIDCPSTGACMVTTNDGTVITMTPTGVTYTYDVLSTISDIDCASAQSCVAVDGNEAAFWDGSTWSAGVATPAVVTSVSCPVARHCVAAGNTGVETVDW